MTRRLLTILALALIVATCLHTARACTGLSLRPRDGSILFGRTLEFAQDLKSKVLVVPRSYKYIGSAPEGKPGLQWETQYGAVGMNAFDLPYLVDGVNEQGLSVGAFYFPGYAEYQAVAEEDYPVTLAPHEFPVFLLTTCSSVVDVLAAMDEIRVAAVVFKQFGGVPPAHFIVTDADGNCIVIEPVAGALKIHRNPLGVITNSPTFDWHLTNLSNYINLSIFNVPPLDVDGLTLRGFGQGTGMLGLPGDFTPPSRFVRAAAFSRSALPTATAGDGISQMFHLLNQFDIPKGSARGTEGDQEVTDYTLWTSATDLTNRRYYFHTYDNRTIRVLDLRTVNFTGAKPRSISIDGSERVQDLSTAGE